MGLEQLDDLGHRELASLDFALINPLRVSEDRWRDLPVAPLRTPAFKAQPHLVPRLLPLASLDARQQVEVLERNDRQCGETGQPMFCALLASDADPHALAGSLGGRMLIVNPARQTVWLRFHDPKVFSALAWWLDPDQMARLMGHVLRWTWYEPRDARWHQLERPCDPRPERLTLGETQWDRLDRQPLVNRSLKELGIRPPLERPLRELVERLDAHLCQAAAAGLVEAADLCRFAVMTERHGQAWVGHPVAARALRAAADGEQTLPAGLESLDEAGMQQWMRTSAQHTETHT